MWESVRIVGFPGTVPQHVQPWALFMHGPLHLLRGLPAALFAREAPDMHVCRSVAAAGVQLQPGKWAFEPPAR